MRWTLADGGDPYALAAAEVERHRQAPLPGLPPFAGGAVGFFGYDCVRTVEPLGEPNPDPIGLPDLALMLTDALVAFDHLKHTVTILANAYVEEEGVDAALRARARASSPRSASGSPARCRGSRAPPSPRRSSRRTCRARRSRRWSRRIVEYVHAGDAFQVVPSQRWSAEVDVDAFSSTAACARSTRRRTCTSSTSRTSRSSARRPSRS